MERWTLLTARNQSCLCFFLSLNTLWFAQFCCEAISVPSHNASFILVLADWNLHMLQTPSPERRDAWPTNCTPYDAHASFFLYFQYSTCKTYLCHFRTLRLAILLITSCCYERNSIHTASLSYFISLIHSAHHLFFMQPWTVAEFT